MSDLTNLKLKNFTAFADLDLEFSPGVNVLIGANGSGKTHLLKILYAACAITTGEGKEKSFAAKLVNVFNPYEGRIGRLSRRQAKSVTTRISVRSNRNELFASFSNHTKSITDVNQRRIMWRREVVSAYIPVKEMLAHAPGFLALAAKREIAFEEVYVDLIKQAFLPKLKGPVDHGRKRLLEALERAIEGKVVAKGEYFFLKNRQGDLEFSLLAEGVRKLALIWLLIQNGTLLSGSVLFWDEPEANLNPSLMGQVVEVILELQRLGVQVFLSTHNYVVLKEFDLRKTKKDQIRYVSLYRGENGVVSNSTDRYADIEPNAIADTFTKLYDEEVRRGLGGVAK